MTKFTIVYNLEGAGWDNLLPTEQIRIAGSLIPTLLKTNAAGGTVAGCEVDYAGKHQQVPVKEFAHR